MTVGMSAYLADELHVTVLNTVVDHLDVVTSTLITDPLAASLVVALGGDALEDLLDVGPGSLVTTGHDGGTVAGTLLTTGDTGADESETLLGQVLGSAVGVGEVGVTTVDDDVALLEQGQEGLDPVVDGLSSLDEQHDTAGLLELGDELLVGVSTDNGLALGLVVQEAVNLGDGSVIGADGETVVGHVQNQVLAPGLGYQYASIAKTCRPEKTRHSGGGFDLHDGQTDETEVSAFMRVSTIPTTRRLR